MPYTNSRTRLRILTSTLCMVIAALVLVWGSAFKASLYHSYRDLAHVPAAKLLTEHERPAHTGQIDLSRTDIPPVPQAMHHVPAAAPAPSRHALTLLAMLSPHRSSVRFTHDAALGFYFHHPPPLF